MGRLSIRDLLSSVWVLSRANWPALLAAAVLVFVPVGLLQSLAGDYPEVGDGADAVEVARALALFSGSAAVSLLAAALFAGIVGAIVARQEQNDGDSYRPHRIARSLPYARLVAVDLLYGAIVSVGLVLLIIPGVVFLVWFALAGPALAPEGHGPIGALRRSRNLVRGNFLRVGALVVPLVIGSELIAESVFSGSVSLFGDSWISEWAGDSLAEILTVPILGLVLTVMFNDLAGRGRSPTIRH